MDKTKKIIHNKCPEGYVKRKGYTRKSSGKYIKGVIIRSTSPYSTNPMTTRKSRKPLKSKKSTKQSSRKSVKKSKK
jgi:hypothetical protein